jgi:hypothetical protein
MKFLCRKEPTYKYHRLLDLLQSIDIEEKGEDKLRVKVKIGSLNRALENSLNISQC